MSLILSMNISQADNCKSFTVTDQTEAYDATLNTGGYGSPNPATTDIDEAEIAVTVHLSNSTYTVDVYPTFPTTTNTTEVTISNTDLGLSSTEQITDAVRLIEYTVRGGFAITNVTTGTKTFRVSGDKSATFAVGDTFEVDGSTANDGTYTVTAITYSNPNTLITVSETIPSSTVDGEIRFTATTSQYEIFYCQGRQCLYDKLQLVEASSCEECNNERISLINKINTFLLAAGYAAKCGKPNKAAALIAYLNKLCNLTDCSGCN